MSPITDWEALTKDAKEASKGFVPAPEGTYNLTITEVVPDIAKNSGNQKFSATMVIDSGEYKGKKLWHDFTITRENKRGLNIFFQNMAVLGMPFEFFNASTTNESIVANMVNKRISADVIVDEYNPEKPKNKIDKGWTIKAPTGPAELDLLNSGTNSGVPGGATMAAPPTQPTSYTNGAPTVPQQQAPVTPPQQQQQYVPQQPVPQQQPQPSTQEDPWAAPPPPPPSNANWAAPPPPPPGFQP